MASLEEIETRVDDPNYDDDGAIDDLVVGRKYAQWRLLQCPNTKKDWICILPIERSFNYISRSEILQQIPMHVSMFHWPGLQISGLCLSRAFHMESNFGMESCG